MSTSALTDAQAVQAAMDELDELEVLSCGGAERLDDAACAPAITHLAKIAIGAATRGCSRDGWRTEVTKARGPNCAMQLDEAEECMHHSGLWPWG